MHRVRSIEATNLDSIRITAEGVEISLEQRIPDEKGEFVEFNNYRVQFSWHHLKILAHILEESSDGNDNS